jgi:hypothetical protein
MRKAIFCMHTGMAQADALLAAFRSVLSTDDWCFADDELGSMHGVQGNYALVEAGVNKRFQRFSNSVNGIVETNDAFIKNFNQAATIKFGKHLQLIHLVRDPLAVASALAAQGSYPDKVNPRHLLTGRYIGFKDDWSPFQKNLWEWVDCNIAAVFLSQEINRANVFVLPQHKMWHGKIEECLRWVQADLQFGLDKAMFQTRWQHTDQDDVESFTWYNGLTPSEQRITALLFKELMSLGALEFPPAFIKNRI